MDPTTVITAALSAAAALGAAWITSRVAGRANRRDAMLRWAEQLQASEEAAQRRARESEERADRIKGEADTNVRELRGQIDAIQIQLDMAQRAAARLTDTLVSVAVEVWRPEPDISALRELVGRPHVRGVNGREV